MDRESLLLSGAAVINAMIIHVRRKRKNKKKVIRKPWLKRRSEKGFGILKMVNEELAVEDLDSYKNFLRVSEDQFDFLLNLVRTDIEKEPSMMQETISARNRFVLCNMLLPFTSF